MLQAARNFSGFKPNTPQGGRTTLSYSSLNALSCRFLLATWLAFFLLTILFFIHYSEKNMKRKCQKPLLLLVFTKR
jgi:hypothetical protein